jgi:cytochrome c-type biogenesis protein CcmH
MIRVLAAVVALCASFSVMAIDTGKAFDDPELQARYEKIIDEVRCLKCQNQTIKDSSAFLADDLRREIRRLLTEGKTDAEVFDFLVERYGDFALYRPRMSGITLLLWIAPGVFLLVGGFVVVRVLRKRMAMPIDIDDDTIPIDIDDESEPGQVAS